VSTRCGAAAEDSLFLPPDERERVPCIGGRDGEHRHDVAAPPDDRDRRVVETAAEHEPRLIAEIDTRAGAPPDWQAIARGSASLGSGDGRQAPRIRRGRLALGNRDPPSTPPDVAAITMAAMAALGVRSGSLAFARRTRSRCKQPV
jgi:hypothetical protein